MKVGGPNYFNGANFMIFFKLDVEDSLIDSGYLG